MRSYIHFQRQEREAKVIITDDKGGRTNLAHIGKGIYETQDSNYVGTIGNSYQVNIELKDGRKYISKPEKIKPPIPISKLSVQFTRDDNTNYPASLHVYVNTKDPEGEENFYKWNFYSWVFRETHGVPCGFGCVMYKYCFQKFIDKEVRILSDATINGNEIKNKDVGKSYIYTYGNHYVDISQSTLTKEAYQFWERYEDQVIRSGNILDPLPAAIRGNVYNTADSTDLALGYFIASSVTRRRAILIPFNITDYLLQATAATFIPEGPRICFNSFPNTLIYTAPASYTPPEGWENAERIEVRW